MATLEPAASPSTDPRAWTAATSDAPPAWYHPLPQAARAVIEAELASFRRDPRPVPEIAVPAPARERLAAALEPVRQALEHGRGFAVVEGPNPAGLPESEVTAAYWLVGHGLGAPVAQNVQGTLLYDVRDTGQTVAAGARFSVTNAGSTYHTDNSFGDTVVDYVGLQCLRTARTGGLNQVVSGHAAIDALRQEYPEALAILEHPFHVDRRGGVRPGEAPTARMPVIRRHGEELEFRYLRTWIEAGHQKAGEPLTDGQRWALDTLDACLSRPELRVEFGLRPGEMFFINNRWILHNRTAFEDHPEPERRRHYVRLWLRRNACPRR